MLSRSTILHLRFPFSYFLMPIYLMALTFVPVADGFRAAVVFVVLHLLREGRRNPEPAPGSSRNLRFHFRFLYVCHYRVLRPLFLDRSAFPRDSFCIVAGAELWLFSGMDLSRVPGREKCRL
jgi:hypothetical protein